MADEKILLEMKNVNKQFPGVKALDHVSLAVRAGEVHALLGENGAGKSTLIKVLGGIYKADSGEIYVEGKKVEIHSVKDAQANGIAIIHQELVLVPYMTVAENIFLGREIMTGRFVNHRAMEEQAQKLLDDYHLKIDASELLVNLTIAQQQMVEIIKAISYNSRILVMDEPTSSISDKEVEFLFGIMRSLTAKGVGIIYISHKMSELQQICDRVTVMRDGASIGTKVVRETANDELISMMVGRTLTSYYTRDFTKGGEVILKAEHISDGDMVKDASFEVRKGEIVGFAGLVGAGRSETMQAIFGLNKKAKGQVWAVTERTLAASTPLSALRTEGDGETRRRWGLEFLGRRFNFYGNSSNYDRECAKISILYPITLPTGQSLPFGLWQTGWTAWSETPVPVNAESAEQFLRSTLTRRVETLLGDGEILDAQWQTEQREGVITVTLHARCLEQIGTTVELN